MKMGTKLDSILIDISTRIGQYRINQTITEITASGARFRLNYYPNNSMHNIRNRTKQTVYSLLEKLIPNEYLTQGQERAKELGRRPAII